MLEFAHALTGAVIAYNIHNPVIALPLALASHFVTDFLPHWNFDLDKAKNAKGLLRGKIVYHIFVDSFLGLVLGLLVAAKTLPDVSRTVVIIAGAFLAVLPDLIEAPLYFFGWKNKFIDRLLDFQKKHQWNVSFWPGIISQIAYTVFLLFWLR